MAMTWLTEDDLKTVIEGDVLTELKGENSNRLDYAENMAMSEVIDLINNRYNTAAIFAATGASRHKSVVRVMVDLAIYHAHANINANNIPELRQKRYDKALKDLKEWRDGITAPLGLPLAEDDNSDEVDDEGNLIPPGLWGLFSSGKFNSDY